MKRLKDGDVVGIFNLRGVGYSLAEIGEAYGISRQFVLKILQRQAYSHVKIEDSLLRLSDSLVPEIGGIRKKRNEIIINLSETGHSGVDISKLTECAPSTVCRVLKAHRKESAEI